jgi:two-component system, OmpR family, osmolarity sensor histidine kinase EnvZ
MTRSHEAGKKMTATIPELTARSYVPRRPGFGGLIKRMLPQTLFGRSLLIIVTPVILLQVVATWIFYDRHWDTMTNRLAYAVGGEIGMVIEQLERDVTMADRTETLSMAARTMDLIITFEPDAILPPQRQKLSSLLERTLGMALDERVRKPFLIDTRVASNWIEIRVQMADGVLSVMSPERRLFSSTTYIFLLWMVGAAMVLFAIAIIFMRNQIRPIRRLAAAADAFGKGRDVTRFKLEGATEVRQAAAAFLVMRERIQRQISQRTEMLAGVSHDLRTPLTRMKIQLELFTDCADVEDLKADVIDMEQMIEGYLAFARGEGAEAPVPTDLNRLINEAVSSARRDGAIVDLHLEGELSLPLRPNSVKRCLANLIGNARRYADHVWVQAGRRDDAIEITVDDDGPGIPASSHEDVFRPFFRLEGSRNRSTGGVGLGLTIARDVIRSHGGDITLSDSPRGGLRAVVRLPV